VSSLFGSNLCRRNCSLLWQGFVKVTGRKQHKISEEKVEELIKAFEQMEYFSFEDKYDSDGKRNERDRPTDHDDIIFLEWQQKKVVNYYSTPKELETLEDKIDEIAGLYEYIGPL
jgi:hypothetical protein